MKKINVKKTGDIFNIEIFKSEKKEVKLKFFQIGGEFLEIIAAPNLLSALKTAAHL